MVSEEEMPFLYFLGHLSVGIGLPLVVRHRRLLPMFLEAILYE